MNTVRDKSGNGCSRRQFLAHMSAFGVAAFLGSPRTAAADPPPETPRVRLLHSPAICTVPQDLAEEMLYLEGFSEVEYVKNEANDNLQYVRARQVDVTTQDAPTVVVSLDARDPLVVLAGMHTGCWELFGSPRIRALRELRGHTVAISGVGDFDHRFLSSIFAYVGLDPRKDIHWVQAGSSPQAMQLFAEGKAEAFFGFPPQPQELRARGIGQVLLNMTEDRPWSQYFCCMLTVRREFAQRYPVATKRVLRAYLKAVDLCAQEPERAAQFLVDKGYEPRYAVALEVLKSLPYRRWRDTDPEDTLRFYALRLHEVGMIKLAPKKLLAQGTDWRFLNALKKELKG